jgi:hypothetical protein
MTELPPFHPFDLFRIDERAERVFEGLILVGCLEAETAGQFLRFEELVGIPRKKFQDSVCYGFDGSILPILFSEMQAARKGLIAAGM